MHNIFYFSGEFHQQTDGVAMKGPASSIVATKFTIFKGELQRQNKLISSERPFKILQNETKIIKIGHAVLEIFNFQD